MGDACIVRSTVSVTQVARCGRRGRARYLVTRENDEGGKWLCRSKARNYIAEIIDVQNMYCTYEIESLEMSCLNLC